MKRVFCTYIMASQTGVIYVGVTGNLAQRVDQHKAHINTDSFTSKYDCNKLVYFEASKYVLNAIAREKQIKRWRREKKVNLINSVNPQWNDLSEGLIDLQC